MKKWIVYLALFMAIGAGLTVARGSVQAQEDLDTILAKSAAKGFLITLLRPDLAKNRDFYLVKGLNANDILSQFKDGQISAYLITKSGWLTGSNQYQTEALLQPGSRLLTLNSGRSEGRWKIEEFKFAPLATPAVVTGTMRATSPSTGTTASDFPPINNGLSGLIAFQVHSGSDIYVIRANGTGLRKVTTGIDPELSPDGKKILFTRWQPEYALYTINVDGTGEQKLASNWRQMKSASWSPDGTQVVFSYQGGGQLNDENYDVNLAKVFQNGDKIKIPKNARDLEVEDGILKYRVPMDAFWHLQQINLQNGQLIETATGSIYSYGSNWHPTQLGKIIFRGDRGLGLYDVNTKTTQRLTTDDHDKAAVISPDGTKIALTYWQDGHWEVHSMNSDGSNRKRLTQTSTAVEASKRIQFQEVVTNAEGYLTLKSAQPEGQPLVDWQNGAPAWSPDSRKLLFMTNRTGKWEIWIMNPDGSDQHAMFTNGALANIPLQYDGVDERMMSWRSVK